MMDEFMCNSVLIWESDNDLLNNLITALLSYIVWCLVLCAFICYINNAHSINCN